VIDISDPTTPVYVSDYDSPGNANDVAVAGNFAYVAKDYSFDGLEVMDISDPANPMLAGSIETVDGLYGVKVSGNFAFCVDDTGYSMVTIDISDPTNPLPISTYLTPVRANHIQIAGDRVYLTSDFSPEMYIIDVSDPANPVYAGSYGYNVVDVAISGNHAFVTQTSSGLDIIQISAAGIDANRRYSRSLELDAAGYTIPRARINSAENGGMSWELSADSGLNWTDIVADGTLQRIAEPGTDLIWRALHTWSPGLNPAVTDLTIEWLNDFAPISSIADVPDDQGGWVRMTSTRSGYDFADELEWPVTGYGIYRRVDSASLREAILNAPEISAVNSAPLNSFDYAILRQVGDRVFVLGEDAEGERASSEFPPGIWELTQFNPAVQHDSYLSLLPTVADSTAQNGIHWSVFMTTTHTTTPSVWFASQPDSGYSMDNLAPGVPSAFVVDHDPYGISNLSWDESADEDFQYFRVYRGESEDFEIGPEALVHETVETVWIDSEGGQGFFYKVTALDYAGNESDPAEPDEVTGSDSTTPRVFALHQNSPNPFNPSTVIRFDLPRASLVKLEIFDVNGRCVTTLLDETLDTGRHSVSWNGRSERGHPLSSGLYFYSLKAADFSENRKMLLLK
jgi:hypothetical protein